VLANHPLVSRFLLLVFVVAASSVALSSHGAAEIGEGKSFAPDARRAAGLAAWENDSFSRVRMIRDDRRTD
jgi:hypothetical protein